MATVVKTETAGDGSDLVMVTADTGNLNLVEFVVRKHIMESPEWPQILDSTVKYITGQAERGTTQ